MSRSARYPIQSGWPCFVLVWRASPCVAWSAMSRKLPLLRLLGLLLPTAGLTLGCAEEEPLADDEAGDSGTDDEGATEDESDGETDDEIGTEETTDTGEPADPLPDAPVGEWLYVEIDGMMCRDGSQAGIGVRYAPGADKLALYMQGGGACFNGLTCNLNPSSVDSNLFNPGPSGGIFDAENPQNPMRDYNFVYFPYCTGDIFFGSKPNSDVPGGPTNQMFVGHDNVILALERIVDTWPDATVVTATGESGGGFGAASNYDTIAGYFPGIDVTLVDDSGPIFRDMYLAPCLQQTFRDVWGIDASLPEDCTECFGSDGGGLWNYLPFIQEKYPNAIKSLISSEADGTISTFYGFGNDNCMALFPSFPNFEDALYDLRDNALSGASWASYIKTGNSHTYLGGDSTLYGTTSGGVPLNEWLTDVLNGTPSHVQP